MNALFFVGFVALALTLIALAIGHFGFWPVLAFLVVLKALEK